MGQHESQETPGRLARHTRSARLRMIGAASVRLTRMPAPDAGRHLVPTYPPPLASTSSRTCTGIRSRIPIAGWRTRTSTETKDWSAAQDALLQDARGGWPGRDHLRGTAVGAAVRRGSSRLRCGAVSGSSSCGVRLPRSTPSC